MSVNYLVSLLENGKNMKSHQEHHESTAEAFLSDRVEYLLFMLRKIHFRAVVTFLMDGIRLIT